jgi:hypothetical protein
VVFSLGRPTLAVVGADGPADGTAEIPPGDLVAAVPDTVSSKWLDEAP